jgi:hypothetical protein
MGALELLAFLAVPLIFVALSLLWLRTAGEHFVRWPDGGGGGPVSRIFPSPWVWLAIAAVMLLLGLFVFPRFLPGVFLFLPFFWVGGRRRGRGAPPDPLRCPACGRPIHPEHDFCPGCGTKLPT